MDHTEKLSLQCWDALYRGMRRDYIRMVDQGGQAGTLKFVRTKTEMGLVRELIYARFLD